MDFNIFLPYNMSREDQSYIANALASAMGYEVHERAAPGLPVLIIGGYSSRIYVQGFPIPEATDIMVNDDLSIGEVYV